MGLIELLFFRVLGFQIILNVHVISEEMDGVLNIAEGNQEFKEHTRRDTGSESSDGSTIPTISPEPEENSTNEYLTLNQEKMQYLIDDYIPPAKVN